MMAKPKKSVSKKPTKMRAKKATPTRGSARRNSKKSSKAPDKDPRGGLTAAGRRAFAILDGSHLKPEVTRPISQMTPQDMRRKGSWAVAVLRPQKAAPARRLQRTTNAICVVRPCLGRAGPENCSGGAAKGANATAPWRREAAGNPTLLKARIKTHSPLCLNLVPPGASGSEHTAFGRGEAPTRESPSDGAWNRTRPSSEKSSADRNGTCSLLVCCPFRPLRQGSLSPTPRSGSVVCAIDLREIACEINWLPLHGVRPSGSLGEVFQKSFSNALNWSPCGT